MIDTDKYENITPERWTVDEEDPYRVVDVQECTIARTDFVNIEEEREWQLANARLIADAPLLLAEVKRLQNDLGVMSELLVEAAHCIHEMEGMAYAEADPDDFAKHAMEFRGNVSTTIGADAPWGDEE